MAATQIDPDVVLSGSPRRSLQMAAALLLTVLDRVPEPNGVAVWRCRQGHRIEASAFIDDAGRTVSCSDGDLVSLVERVARLLAGVSLRLGIEKFTECIGKEQLAGQASDPVSSNFRMYVRGAAGIPARLDGPKDCRAVVVAGLRAAQEPSVLPSPVRWRLFTAAKPRIATGSITIPDVDDLALKPRAGLVPKL